MSMEDLMFAPRHPLQQFTKQEKQLDYSEKDNHYIRSIQAMEETMDIDAYIIDYRNEQILYISKRCSLRKAFRNDKQMSTPFRYDLLNKIIPAEDLGKIEIVKRFEYDFYFNLPVNRRYRWTSSLDIRVKDRSGKYILMNHKVSVLDMMEDGRLRLGLCVVSYPTGRIPGKLYFKMSDTSTVYEYIEKSQKFVEVKIQRLTPKAEKVLELASRGKTENEIANILGISINTVKYHKRMILSQLNVRNTTEAVQWMNSQKTLADDF